MKRRKKVGIWQTYFMYDNFTPHFGLNNYVIYVNVDWWAQNGTEGRVFPTFNIDFYKQDEK